jgi:SprT protein
MPDFLAIRKLANQLIDLHIHSKEEITEEWSFQFDHSKTRAGCCYYTRNLITLSRILCEVMDENQIRNTLLHEIAHALAGHSAGHGPRWKSIARSLGCTAERCHTYDTTKTAKYVGNCSCRSHHWQRKPKYKQYKCLHCGETVTVKPIDTGDDDED